MKGGGLALHKWWWLAYLVAFSFIFFLLTVVIDDGSASDASADFGAGPCWLAAATFGAASSTVAGLTGLAVWAEASAGRTGPSPVSGPTVEFSVLAILPVSVLAELVSVSATVQLTSAPKFALALPSIAVAYLAVSAGSILGFGCGFSSGLALTSQCDFESGTIYSSVSQSLCPHWLLTLVRHYKCCFVDL